MNTHNELDSSKGTRLEMALYNLALAGADEECGSTDSIGWHALIVGPFRMGGAFADFTPQTLTSLSDEDKETLAGAAGAIVRENGDGFVYAETFATEAGLTAAWRSVRELDAATAD